ncbi:hypothetical protein DFH08DRAFT_699563, partial [Mycena albidolilacea]
IGIYSYITQTQTPPNHSSSLEHTNKGRAGGRYTGPFSRSRLESLIGPFRTSLLPFMIIFS